MERNLDLVPNPVVMGLRAFLWALFTHNSGCYQLENSFSPIAKNVGIHHFLEKVSGFSSFMLDYQRVNHGGYPIDGR